MEEKKFFRVVSLRKGKIKPADFKLRKGEKGLSLFAFSDQVKPEEVIEAVRMAGKSGDLSPVFISIQELGDLGLVLYQTPGQTPNAEINNLHWEARVPFWRRFLLWLRGISVHDYFNDRFSAELCARAKLEE